MTRPAVLAVTKEKQVPQGLQHSNLLFREFGVLGVGVDAPDVNLFGWEEDHGNQAVVVAFDVEDIAVVGDVIGRGHVALQVVQVGPLREFHLRKPDVQFFACLGVGISVVGNGFLAEYSHPRGEMIPRCREKSGALYTKYTRHALYTTKLIQKFIKFEICLPKTETL